LKEGTRGVSLRCCEYPITYRPVAYLSWERFLAGAKRLREEG